MFIEHPDPDPEDYYDRDSYQHWHETPEELLEGICEEVGEQWVDHELECALAGTWCHPHGGMWWMKESVPPPAQMELAL